MRAWGLLIPALLLALPSLSASRETAPLAGRLESLDEAAPDFLLRDASGSPVRLSGLRGRPVILHFWATWCASCRTELPAIDAFARRLAATDVEILLIAIDTDTDGDAVRAYAKALGVALPVFRAGDGDVTDRYWTWGVPVTYLIDRNGWIAGRVRGPLDWTSVATAAAIEGFATP